MLCSSDPAAAILRLLTSLAIRCGTTLKQGDCKNDFAQAYLHDDEAYVHCQLEEN